MMFQARFLVEAAVNYNEMFSSVFKTLKAVQEEKLAQGIEIREPGPDGRYPVEHALDQKIQDAITWAETNLKKNYRIVWYLRWVKLAILRHWAKSVIPDKDPIWANGFTTAYERELAKFNAKSPQPITDKDVLDRDVLGQTFRGDLKHYFDTAHLTKVQEFPLDWQTPLAVIDIFHGFQQEYNEKYNKMLKPSDIKPDDKIIVQFPNGWAWWLMDRGRDDAEGRCMGHCGTGESGSKLISLREPHKEKGVTYWEPHLTFELDKDGHLRQTKGRSNSKPKAEYHPYIVELLKQPLIKGNRGGGYREETNFNTDDLTEEQRDEVSWDNPSVMGYYPELPGDNTVVEFPSGQQWRSDLFGDAGDLWLVEPKTNPKTGQTVWKRDAHFEVDDRGYLTLMKIDGNRDSQDNGFLDAAYAAGQLLQQPFIKGITYPPYDDTNFSMDDLPAEQRDRLYELKPALMTPDAYFSKHGADRTFAEKVLRYAQGKGEEQSIQYRPEQQDFVVERFPNVENLLDRRGDDTVEYILKVMNGEEYLDYGSYEEDAESMLDYVLSKEQTEKIGLILKKEYADELSEWLEEEGRDSEDDEFDPTDKSEVLSLAKYVGDDIVEILGRAYSDGRRYGAEKDMYNSLKKAMDDNKLYVAKDSDPDHFWSSEWLAVISPRDALDIMNDDNYFDGYDNYVPDDYKIEVSRPYRGWDDFDEKGALESFENEYPIDQKFRDTLGDAAVKQFEAQKELDKQMKQEWSRVIDTLRRTLADEPRGSERRREAENAQRAFMHGDYDDLVGLVRQVDPDAFSFYHPEEQGEEEPETAEEALAD